MLGKICFIFIKMFFFSFIYLWWQTFQNFHYKTVHQYIPLMFLSHTRYDMSKMAYVLQEAETAGSFGAPESTFGFFGWVHIVHLFLVFSVDSMLFFLSCPCCSAEFVSNCGFPFALNIPLVFLYFSPTNMDDRLCRNRWTKVIS